MAQPLTWGHTPIPEMDFGLITQESPAFRHGECQTKLAGVSVWHMGVLGAWLGMATKRRHPVAGGDGRSLPTVHRGD